MVLVACGWRHSVTVSSSGGLYTYGWSKYGQLGHGDFEDHLVPRKIEALKDVSISQVLNLSATLISREEKWTTLTDQKRNLNSPKLPFVRVNIL